MSIDTPRGDPPPVLRPHLTSVIGSGVTARCEHVFVSNGLGDPARRRRLVLRVGRATRRPQPPRTSRDRRCRRGAGGQLRGEGVRHRHTDGRSPGAQAVPARGRRSPADGCVQRGEQALFEVFNDTTPFVEGLSGSTKRSSTSVDCGGSPVRRWRSPSDCGERSSRGWASRHRRCRQDEVPREGGQRRREARRSARWCRSTVSSSSCTP